MSDPIVPVVTPASADQQIQQPVLPNGVPPVQAPVRMDGVPSVQPVQPVQPVQEPDTKVEQSNLDVNTGNKALDVAISTFASVTGATQADFDRAVANAIEYDNPSLIDKAFIKERFGKHADQALALAEAAVAENVQYTQRIKTEVHTLAGSEQQWNNAVSVFNSSATETIKQAVKALMDQGNIKGGAELLLQTVQGSGLLPNVNPSLNGGSAAGGVAGALTSAQFQQELSALRKEAGNRSFETGPLAQKYNQLITRRQAGKQLGI